MLITFSGVDCAGKSTHIELLKQYFISQGKTCTVFWYRPGYSDELQKIKSFIRQSAQWAHKIHTDGLNHFLPSSHHSNPDPIKSQDKSSDQAETHKLKAPAPLWLSTAILDTTLQWSVKLRYLLHKYDVVICDRYVEDAKLDLSFKFPNLIWTDLTLDTLTHLFPKPDKSFLLMLPFDEMIHRAEMKNEPFPDDANTRKLRYRAYEFLADEDHISCIDASGDIQTTHQKIIDAL